MQIVRFTVREMDLLCLYYSGTRLETLAQLREAMPCIDAPDVLAVAERAAAKLEGMCDEGFATISFDPEPLPPVVADSKGNIV